jgi:hypothetical protein
LAAKLSGSLASFLIETWGKGNEILVVVPLVLTLKALPTRVAPPELVMP